jgi:ATP-dependent RNA helicase MSS116
MRALPDPTQSRTGRQSLFFSATIPPFVHDVAKLKPDHVFISTLKEEDVNTHEHVPQEYKIIPIRNSLAEALKVVTLEAQTSRSDHKIIIFCPTARATSLAAELFRQVPILDKQNFSILGPIYEIHSRKSQSARTKTMADFKASANGILFSSDVTARGVDIPGITLVMQLGLPMNSEQYIHRLGRTARAGKEGRGVLILDEHEKWFLTSKGVKELPLNPLNGGQDALFDKCSATVKSALSVVDETLKCQAYAAVSHHQTLLQYLLLRMY